MEVARNARRTGAAESYMRDRSAILKQAFDLMAATVGLLVLSPLFLGIAILIKLDSDGPVFYRVCESVKVASHSAFSNFAR